VLSWANAYRIFSVVELKKQSIFQQFSGENLMTSITKLLALSSLLMVSAPLWADDSPSAPPVKTHKQKMDECLDRQHASNSNMSQHDMKKACDKELQSLDTRPSTPPALVPAHP
jgi:hypothetical protein